MYGINPKKELEIFNNLLMNKVKVSNKDYYQVIRSKKYAHKFTHIQYNHCSGSNYIFLDCDKDALQTIEETNLKPNIVSVNQDNGRGHIGFRFNSFVGTTANASIKPQKALRLLNHSLNNYLGTDKAFNGVQCKNPLYHGFRIFSFSDQGYDFAELFDNIPDEHIYINQPEKIVIEDKEVLAVVNGERNAYLFDTVRFKSYQIKHKFKNYEDFFTEIERIYNDLNAMLSDPLPFKECQHSIKSIATWTWNNYTGEDGKNRGVMQLDSKGHNLTLQDKQIIGAKYSHKIRTEATEQRIIETVKALQAKGEKITQKAVAEHSGLNKNTLTKYKDLIKKLK